MQDDIERAIVTNKGLLYKQLSKFCLRDDHDAESIGYEALYNAVITYDTTKNVKFSTYATVCIYNALGNYVRSLNRKRKLDVVSYNTPISDNNEDELMHQIPSEVRVESGIIRSEVTHAVKSAVQQQYLMLTNDKHKAIVDVWRNADYNIPLVDVANQVGVSQAYVSFVLCKFKNSLKQVLEEYYYD